MEEFLINNGLIALFFLSFLAATVIPLGSEWLLIVLLLNNHDPYGAIAVATLGNTLGACTTYLIGLWGADYLIRRLLQISPSDQQRAETLYTRYGSCSLLFSWLPIVGDPLCLVGGLLKINFLLFLCLVFVGKLARYVTIGFITTQSMM